MTKLTFPSLAKFTAFVELKDFRGPTKKEYVRYLRKLGEHYQCDPAALSEDQLRAYFLFLRQEKKFGSWGKLASELCVVNNPRVET
jgi:hypothetical protein